MWISPKMIIAILIIAFALCAGLFAWMHPAQGSMKWQTTNVRHHLPDLNFNLTSDTNESVSAENYKGKVVLLFFGYTSCSDECPATMMRLTNVLKQLGPDADRIQVLFVTVDPSVDTPKVLHDYMGNFNPMHITGLRGTAGQIEALAKRYRAAYAPRKNKDDDVVHSNAIYIFDTQGHAQLLATPEDSDETLIHDLHQLAEAS